MQRTEMQKRFVSLQDNWGDMLGGTFDYTFLVYGMPEDVEFFCAPADWKNFRNQDHLVLVGGEITPGITDSRGLLLVTGVSPRELVLSRILSQLLEQQAGFTELVGAGTAGMAGVLPSLVKRGLDKEKISPNLFSSLFVKGLMGSTWLIVNEVRKLTPSPCKIGILGMGYLGGLVKDSLESLDYEVLGIDVGADESEKQQLKTCELVVVLTPKGDDVSEYTDYIVATDSSVAKILFDSHPVPGTEVILSFIARSIETFQTAATIQGVKTLPTLPKFSQGEIPGCLLDAIVRSIFGNNGEVDFATFDRFAAYSKIETPEIAITMET